jgi:hypothetical protein
VAAPAVTGAAAAAGSDLLSAIRGGAQRRAAKGDEELVEMEARLAQRRGEQATAGGHAASLSHALNGLRRQVGTLGSSEEEQESDDEEEQSGWGSADDDDGAGGGFGGAPARRPGGFRLSKHQLGGVGGAAPAPAPAAAAPRRPTPWGMTSGGVTHAPRQPPMLGRRVSPLTGARCRCRLPAAQRD